MPRNVITRIVSAILLTASCAMVAPTNAGLVWFSRANCANNESITWDWPGNNYWLWTDGFHYKFQQRAWEPRISTGWEWTYRSAAMHWGEGFNGGYYVYGNHYRYVPNVGQIFLGRTATDNCNISYFFPYW